METRERRTAVVLSQSTDGASQRLERVLGANGWRQFAEVDPERFAWTVRVTRASVAVLVGSDPRWTLERLRAVRASVHTPLVVLGRFGSSWVADALRHGADLVIGAAMPEDEMAANIEAVARRADRRLGDASDRLVSGPLDVDLAASLATLDGHPLDLTRTEFRLLVTLMRQHGQSVSIQVLTRQIWELGASDGANALRICVRRLRRKLHDSATSPRFVVSARGFGYRFDPEVIQLSGGMALRDRVADTDAIDLLAGLACEFALCGSGADLAHRLAETLTECRLGDAVAVHAVGGSVMRLQAQSGHSASWEDRCGELPLRTGFASVRAATHEQEIQVLPGTVTRYRDTLQLCRLEEISAMHFLPFQAAGLRGCIGVSRRAATRWSAEGLAVARAAVSLYASHLSVQATARGTF